MKQQEFERLENLLKSSEYEKLSPGDKDWVDEQLGDGKAYSELRKTISEVSEEQEMVVGSGVRSKLMGDFKARNRPAVVRMLNYQAPVVWNMAATLALGFLLWYFLPEKIETQTIREIVELPGSVDTIRVELDPDTVIIQQKVFVDRPVYVDRIVEKERPRKSETLKGTPLTEQARLRDLVISGGE